MVAFIRVVKVGELHARVALLCRDSKKLQPREEKAKMLGTFVLLILMRVKDHPPPPLLKVSLFAPPIEMDLAPRSRIWVVTGNTWGKHPPCSPQNSLRQ